MSRFTAWSFRDGLPRYKITSTQLQHQLTCNLSSQPQFILISQIPPLPAMSCPDCFRGVVSGLHPTGSEITLHGLPTYVAQPEDGVTPKGIVVIVTDAFGWDFVNNRVLSDIYAKKGGFIVYCPDFMDGMILPFSLNF